MNEIVYCAMYNPMIHESIFGVISVHKTRKGAEMAMEFYKKERIEEDDFSKDIEFWTVHEYDLKP